MTDHERKRESKRAFRAVMREMDSTLRFDTCEKSSANVICNFYNLTTVGLVDRPEELDVLRANFQTARKRSIVGLLTGGAVCGLGWRGAFMGVTIGMFSVRQQTFLDLLSIPEESFPFAHRAREILEKEMPESSLLREVRRRRLELFPRAEDSYDEVVWTESPPLPSKTFATLEETFGQSERDRASFPSDSPGDSRVSRRSLRQKKQQDDRQPSNDDDDD